MISRKKCIESVWVFKVVLSFWIINILWIRQSNLLWHFSKTEKLLVKTNFEILYMLNMCIPTDEFRVVYSAICWCKCWLVTVKYYVHMSTIIWKSFIINTGLSRHVDALNNESVVPDQQISKYPSLYLTSLPPNPITIVISFRTVTFINSRPFVSYLKPCFQNESSLKTFHRKWVWFHELFYTRLVLAQRQKGNLEMDY